MKIRRICTVALMVAAMSAMCSCSPSAEELAKKYKELTVELAQAKLDGDEKKAEKIMKEMEALDEKIGDAAEKELKKAKKDVEKGAKKAGKEVEKAFKDLTK